MYFLFQIFQSNIIIITVFSPGSGIPFPNAGSPVAAPPNPAVSLQPIPPVAVPPNPAVASASNSADAVPQPAPIQPGPVDRPGIPVPVAPNGPAGPVGPAGPLGSAASKSPFVASVPGKRRLNFKMIHRHLTGWKYDLFQDWSSIV